MPDPIYAVLVAAILTFTGEIPVTYQDNVVWTDSSGGAHDAFGIAYCDQGKARVVLNRKATAMQEAHELLHAADCVDDGKMNGSLEPVSPLSGPTSPADSAHSWVFWALRHPETATRLLHPLDRASETPSQRTAAHLNLDSPA